jgi:hypothetical protein
MLVDQDKRPWEESGVAHQGYGSLQNNQVVVLSFAGLVSGVTHVEERTVCGCSSAMQKVSAEAPHMHTGARTSICPSQHALRYLGVGFNGRFQRRTLVLGSTYDTFVFLGSCAMMKSNDATSFEVQKHK